MQLQEPGFAVLPPTHHESFASVIRPGTGPLMVGPGEIARRARSRVTHRLESLPILALSVHSACNCRCVMCDIWKANADKREISSDDLERHIDAIRALRVQRVMLTGGEPLLHRNLWALCRQLQALRIRVTLITTGLLIETHAADIAAAVDTVVISLDGDRDAHDAIRRVKGGFDRIAKGVMALHAEYRTPRLIARSVVQRANFASIHQTITAAHRMGFDEISFLAADVSSAAFNRPAPWTEDRIAEVAVAQEDLTGLEASIEGAVSMAPDLFQNGFVAGGRSSLDRILQYYQALSGSRRISHGARATRRGCPPCSSRTAACGRVSSILCMDRRR
jgi:sulfatase maturation enzyme AslB (radical SAM superfamily)